MAQRTFNNTPTGAIPQAAQYVLFYAKENNSMIGHLQPDPAGHLFPEKLPRVASVGLALYRRANKTDQTRPGSARS